MRLKIIIALVLVLFLFGCVKESVKVVKVTDTGDNTPAPAATTAGSADTSTSSASESASTASSDDSSSESSTQSTESVETGADLEVSNFFVSTMYPLPNEDFDVTFKIKNVGTAEIKNFEYSIRFMDGNDVKKSNYYSYEGAIAKGSISDKITKTFSLPEGTYKLVLTLDPGNAFIESDEENNVVEKSIGVQYASTSSGSSVQTSPSYTSDSSSGSTDNSASSSTCIDSDGGKTYSTVGTCKDDYGNDVADICLDINELWEWYCYQDRCTHDSHTCVCDNGKCIS